jgi:hypothetical protein
MRRGAREAAASREARLARRSLAYPASVDVAMRRLFRRSKFLSISASQSERAQVACVAIEGFGLFVIAVFAAISSLVTGPPAC